MYLFYQIIITLIIATSPLIIIYRILKDKEDKFRFKEKFSIFSRNRKKGKLIWFHASSVGEILSIIPIIRNYEKYKSIKQILVTSSTLSSSKVIAKFKFKKTLHQFYPFDHFFLTNRFLNFWRPSIAIFVESEIWPSMFDNLKRKNIPLILLNARLTKKTFNNWMKIKSFSQSTFKKILISFPQNFETKNFLKKLNVSKIKFIGNLKFAENNKILNNQISKNLEFQLKKKKIWVASSTHGKEEIFCAKAHIELKKKIKNLITIIIPRHIHRVDKIIFDLKKLNLNIALHSNQSYDLKNIDIYIVDAFGETEKFHRIACSVFLGGSIIPRGGQNPLEAARYGATILHGPNTDNFKDVYKLLNSLKISKKINSPNQLAKNIIFKKNKFVGLKVKNIGEKILKKTIKELDKLINNELKKT